jgi:hypothetical protein
VHGGQHGVHLDLLGRQHRSLHRQRVTALVGREGLQQPLGLPVVLGPAAPSMLAWLRCPPCSAMNTFWTTAVDWNRRLAAPMSARLC